ncbi:MAG: zf-HC2 domain-containing protein [Phycisphaerae bacterium]|nr:zf-HC2 domain-containing protein [Phycisphaerae bacterium]
MDCHEFESRIADYLGEELPTDDRDACEAHLAACSTCRSRVIECRAVVQKLQRLETVSPELATRQTASLMVVRRPPAWRRVGDAMLKAAAVLAIGVMIGRYSQASESSQPTAPTALAVAPAADIHPDWIELGRQVSSGGSSFAQQLAMLARTVPR